MFEHTILGTAVVAGAALTIAAAAPVPAAAAAHETLPAGAYVFRTAFTPQYFGAGSYIGELKLTVSNDGSIVGFYRNLDVGTFRTVVGGVKGDDVWLDLGPDAAAVAPMSATVHDGKIVGGTYADGQPYAFVADPEKR